MDRCLVSEYIGVLDGVNASTALSMLAAGRGVEEEREASEQVFLPLRAYVRLLREHPSSFCAPELLPRALLHSVAAICRRMQSLLGLRWGLDDTSCAGLQMRSANARHREPGGWVEKLNPADVVRAAGSATNYSGGRPLLSQGAAARAHAESVCSLPDWIGCKVKCDRDANLCRYADCAGVLRACGVVPGSAAAASVDPRAAVGRAGGGPRGGRGGVGGRLGRGPRSLPRGGRGGGGGGGSRAGAAGGRLRNRSGKEKGRAGDGRRGGGAGVDAEGMADDTGGSASRSSPLARARKLP
jgi:hypothetical protein